MNWSPIGFEMAPMRDAGGGVLRGVVGRRGRQSRGGCCKMKLHVLLLLLLLVVVLCCLGQVGADINRTGCNRTVDAGDVLSHPALTGANKGRPYNCWFLVNIPIQLISYALVHLFGGVSITLGWKLSPVVFYY